MSTKIQHASLSRTNRMIYLYIVLFLIHLNPLAAQNAKWQNCVSNEDVTDMKSSGTSTWVATAGGLILLNEALEEVQRFTSINSDLPCNFIIELEVDKEGLLWVSHCYGLSSYDGSAFTDYDVQGFRMTLDADEQVFLTVADGFYSWNGTDFDFIPIGEEVVSFDGGETVVTSDGVIWFTRATFGVFRLYKLENEVLTTFDHTNSDLPFGFAGYHIFSSRPDGTIELLLGKQIFHEASLVAQIDQNIYDYYYEEDGTATALLGTFENGNSVYTLATLDTDYNIVSSAPIDIDGIGRPIFLITDSKTLVGFSAVGLYEIADASASKIDLKETILTSTKVFAMDAVDQTLWFTVGSPNNSVPSVITYADGQWLSKGTDYPFDQSDELLFPTYFDSGIGDTTYMVHDRKSYFQTGDGNWALVSNPDLAPDVDENYASVFIDDNGRKWLMELYTSDIYYDSPDGWKIYPHEIHGARSGAYFSKFNHPETGDLWLSTYNGLSIYNYESVSWSLLEDSDLGIGRDPATMIATADGEVYGIAYDEFFKMNGTTAEILQSADTTGLTNNWKYQSIFKDRNGRIFLGLNGEVAIYDAGSWSYLNRDNSELLYGNINSIYQDADDNYWFTSQGGISIYNAAGLDDHFFDGFHTGVKDSYNEQLLSIYPNPTLGNVSLREMGATPADDIQMVHVYDQSGQQVMQFRELSDPIIDISMLSAGTYILVVKTAGQVHTVKVAKI